MSRKVVIGIIIDSYKEAKFTKTLTDEGYDNITITPQGKNLKLLRILVDPANVGTVQYICTKLEKHFKTLRN